MLSVDVAANLLPAITHQTVDTHMPRLVPVVAVVNRSHDQCLAVTGKRHGRARLITGRFTVDIVSKLQQLAGLIPGAK